MKPKPGALTEKVAQLRAQGLAALGRGDVPAALASLKIVTALTPSDGGAQRGYAAALIRTNKHKEGVAILKKLVETEPNDIELHCVIAELLTTMLDHMTAKQHLERCLALDPKGTNPHGVRARILIRRMQNQLEAQLGKK
ncbi:MAG: tetratricopeptide repeat protein [Deltaproteobacteria bacterium]|nr:tetratricopeptide repeat protein [Deltaproteobacteria bacterium]